MDGSLEGVTSESEGYRVAEQHLGRYVALYLLAGWQYNENAKP